MLDGNISRKRQSTLYFFGKVLGRLFVPLRALVAVAQLKSKKSNRIKKSRAIAWLFFMV